MCGPYGRRFPWRRGGLRVSASSIAATRSSQCSGCGRGEELDASVVMDEGRKLSVHDDLDDGVPVGVAGHRDLRAGSPQDVADLNEIERREHADIRERTVELAIGGIDGANQTVDRCCVGWSEHPH